MRCVPTAVALCIRADNDADKGTARRRASRPDRNGGLVAARAVRPSAREVVTRPSSALALDCRQRRRMRENEAANTTRCAPHERKRHSLYGRQ